MTRRTRSLALAAVVVMSPAAAAQQAWERDLDLVRRTTDAAPLRNIYWVSLPLLPSLPDAADTATALSNKCVGDVDGPSAGDGIFNADDVICHWWTARADRATAGTFTLQQPKRDRCAVDVRIATVALGEIRFVGTPFDIEPGAGLQVTITVLPESPATPRNRARFAGDHDPSFAGRLIAPTPTCTAGQVTNCCGSWARRLDLLSVPFHSLFVRSYELLCGLEGVDWQDADGDGEPDTCWDDVDADGNYDAGEAPTGLFDGLNPCEVSYFRNVEDTDDVVTHRITGSFSGGWTFRGQAFDLTPGDAYGVEVTRTHVPLVFLPDVP